MTTLQHRIAQWDFVRAKLSGIYSDGALRLYPFSAFPDTSEGVTRLGKPGDPHLTSEQSESWKDRIKLQYQLYFPQEGIREIQFHCFKSGEMKNV